MKVEEVKLEDNRYYFLCAAGVGDTMIVCGFYQALKQKYKSAITLLIPEKQEFIIKMFGIKDYIIVDLDCNGIDELLEKYIKLSDKSPNPTKGEIFLAHPTFHLELSEFFLPIYYRKSKIPFLNWYKNFLGLPLDTPFENAINVPQLSESIKEKLLAIDKLENIVLISPESTSTEPINLEFWEDLTVDLIKQGYTVISNVINETHKIKHTKYLDLSLKDAVALAYKCHSTYSVRSGFCDLCYQLNEKLNVYYANRDELFLFSLNTMFDTDKINEYVEYNLPKQLHRTFEKQYSEHDYIYRKYLLFSFIPLFKIKFNSYVKKYYFCGIPFFKTKDYIYKKSFYFLGIRVFKITESRK